VILCHFGLVQRGFLCEKLGMPKPFLSEEQWQRIAPLLPQNKSRGRPWADNRSVLEGILWVLKTGARWRDLPREYPSASTCWRRLQQWEEKGVWLKIWRQFLSELDRRGRLDWSESFLDGSFAPAKKGARPSAKPSGAKARSGWWWSTARVFLWEANWSRPARRK
jgi:transposase